MPPGDVIDLGPCFQEARDMRARALVIAGPASIGLRTGDSIYVHETKRPHVVWQIAESNKPVVFMHGIRRVLSPQEWERV